MITETSTDLGERLNVLADRLSRLEERHNKLVLSAVESAVNTIELELNKMEMDEIVTAFLEKVKSIAVVTDKVVAEALSVLCKKVFKAVAEGNIAAPSEKEKPGVNEEESE